MPRDGPAADAPGALLLGLAEETDEFVLAGALVEDLACGALRQFADAEKQHAPLEAAAGREVLEHRPRAEQRRPERHEEHEERHPLVGRDAPGEPGAGIRDADGQGEPEENEIRPDFREKS